MKSALITGAAGFIGSHLADYLIEKGYTVYGIDNFLTGDRENINHKVNIVDNGSKFGMDLARDISSIYARFPEPIGFARAVNVGFKLAKGECVGVLNNDLVFTEYWLPPLMDTLTNGGAEIVAPVEEKMEGLSEDYWGSCFFMHKATRQSIGLFDEVHLPYRYHDQDYWIRSKQLDYKFRRVGGSVVTHKESTTFNKMDKREEYIRAEEDIMKARYGVVMAAHYTQ